jgi:membrane-associated phospholipid phosphatase
MSAIDYAIDLMLSIMLIIGVYQFYFWCQRNQFAKSRELQLPIDEWLPYWPGWVWLSLVHRFDARSNSFPSMHLSVATLTAMHLQPQFGVAGFAFPVLIAMSCLFTKQHYLIDLPPGAALGWFVYRIYASIS